MKVSQGTPIVKTYAEWTPESFEKTPTDMPLVTDSTQSQSALTPYAITRRHEPKDKRRGDGDRREKSSAYRVQTSRPLKDLSENTSPLDPAEAGDALLKVETGLKADPGIARESQIPNPKLVRAALRR